MKKNSFKALFSFVIAGMMTLSMFSTGTKTVVNAEDLTTYTTTGSETATDIEGIINGSKLNANGDKYTGIIFGVDGNYSFSNEITLDRTFTINTTAGKTVTVNTGIMMKAGTNLTFTGTGSFIIDEQHSGTCNRGLEVSYNDSNIHVFMNKANVTIRNTTGFGVYMAGSGTDKVMDIVGGFFTVENCANGSKEGGIEFDSGTLNVTGGATVNARHNGHSQFGQIYLNAGALNITNNSSVIALNDPNGSEYNATTFLSTTVVIDSSSLNITTNTAGLHDGENGGNAFTASRGIQTDGSSSFIVKNAGSLDINSTSTDVKNAVQSYGINASTVTVDENSSLNVSGFGTALNGTRLIANSKSVVTLDNANIDANVSAIITGGSVKMQPSSSVVKGILTETDSDKLTTTLPNGSKVTATPKNSAGEDLTRFDLTGFTGKSIEISANMADSTKPAYTYNVGTDHSGTAYVWAPAVKVTAYTDATETTQISLQNTYETIRGKSLAYVGATSFEAAPAKAGYVFAGWKVIQAKGVPSMTDFTVNTVMAKDIDIYPLYAPITTIAAATPIDLSESKTVDGEYVNGPLNADVNDNVYYQADIDMSAINTILARYGNRPGYITGEFTLTLTADKSFTFSDAAATYKDIKTYFSGASIDADLFELESATLDKAANTLTLKVKTADSLATDGKSAAVLLKDFTTGITAKSDSDHYLTANSGIATGSHYACLTATLTGSLLYSNEDKLQNFQLNMTSAQIAGKADPTNENGDVSATVNYRTTNVLTADSYTGTYDGAAHTISNVTATAADSTLSYSTVAPDAATEADWSATAPTFTDAGTYTVYVRAQNAYADDVTTSAKVTIAKRNVTLTSGSDSKTYDGTPLTNSTVAVSGDGFATGEGAVYTVTGGRTLIGTSDNTFTYALNTNTDAANYNFTTVFGTLTVRRADTPITPAAPTSEPTVQPAATPATTNTTNTRMATPRTGDQTNAPLAAGIMSGALALAVFAFLARKKYCK